MVTGSSLYWQHWFNSIEAGSSRLSIFSVSIEGILIVQKFQVSEKPITIRDGKVSLTEAQYALRPHCLKKTAKPGIYEVKEPFQLKVGEIFGHDGLLSKADVSALEPAPVAGLKKLQSEPEKSPETEPKEPEEEKEEEPPVNPLSVEALQGVLNLGFMKVKALLKELGVDVADNEAVLDKAVFDELVSKVGGESANVD